MLTFRKYGNRKIYWPEAHRYISLDEIMHYVKLGQEITIVDNKTKRDITAGVMLRHAVSVVSDLELDKAVVMAALRNRWNEALGVKHEQT